MELVILIGLPGAGKSTFYRARFAETHALVSKDLLRNHRRPAERQLALLEAALREGRSVVLDNTNATPAERAAPIALTRARGARVVAYWFPPDVPGSLRRNAARTGRARVPDVAVHVIAGKLRPPAAAEGFDELWAVSLEPGGCRVAPLVSG